MSENKEALFQPHSAALRRSQCSHSWLDTAGEKALPGDLCWGSVVLTQSNQEVLVDPLGFHRHTSTFQMLYSSYRLSWPFILVMSAVKYNSGILMGDMPHRQFPVLIQSSIFIHGQSFRWQLQSRPGIVNHFQDISSASRFI